MVSFGFGACMLVSVSACTSLRLLHMVHDCRAVLWQQERHGNSVCFYLFSFDDALLTSVRLCICLYINQEPSRRPGGRTAAQQGAIYAGQTTFPAVNTSAPDFYFIHEMLPRPNGRLLARIWTIVRLLADPRRLLYHTLIT